MPQLAHTRTAVMCVFGYLVVAPPICNAQHPRADFERVDQFVEAQLKDLNIPGAAITVVSRDGTMHARGFGTAGPGATPATADTPFPLASVTKSITAVAIMQLVESGKVSLDEPVQRYLSWFEALPPEYASRITVRHLLNQTSGLSTVDGRAHMGDVDIALEAHLRELAHTRLRAAPGEQFEYSNANYDLAGAVIEVVSGQRYQHYIENHVFAPLEMSRSFASLTAAKAAGMTQLHQYWFGRPVVSEAPRPGFAIASGFLISSASDMGRLLRAHLNDGALDGRRILRRESVDELHRPAVLAGERQHYAFGWFVDERLGRRMLIHAGDGSDHFAIVNLVPDEGWGFVFLVNAHSYVSGPHVPGLAFQVRRLLLGVPPQPIRRAAGVFAPLLLGLAVLLVAQLLAAVHTVHRARRWRLNGDRAQPGPHRLAWHFVLPALGNLVLAYTVAVVLPRQFGTDLSGARLFAQDAWVLIVISAVFACVWVPARTVLLLWARRPRIRSVSYSG